MRSLPLKAATFLILAGAWGCGSNGSSTGPNTNPTANFTAPSCTAGVACSFTDASTDADGTIASRSWDFGDGTTSQDQNPSHTYLAAGTYTVVLTVTDNAGGTGTKSLPVTVTAGTTGNQAPTAAFTFPTNGCAVNTDCVFTDASTDPDGTIASWAWNFGDGTTATDQSPTHQFGVAGTFTVTLTVTDNLGATATATQSVTVTGAAAQSCTTSGAVVTCSLTMAQKSTIAVALNSTDCQIGGSHVDVTAPRHQTLYFNVCSAHPISAVTVQNSDGSAHVFNPGEVLQITYNRGEVLSPPNPLPGPPSGTITGTSPTWTFTIEDGGNPTGAGEPDNNDVVLGVQATVVS